jgi:hypothetical protein
VEGVTLNFTFLNERLHVVIVLVCHEGTDALARSDVVNDNVQKTTIG